MSASTLESDRISPVHDGEPANHLRHYRHLSVSEANGKGDARFKQYASTARGNDDDITPIQQPQVYSNECHEPPPEALPQEEHRIGCCLPGVWCVWTSRTGTRRRLSKPHLRPPSKKKREQRKSDKSLVRAGPQAEEYTWTLCSRNWWSSKELHMRRWLVKIGWRNRRSAAAPHGVSGQ